MGDSENRGVQNDDYIWLIDIGPQTDGGVTNPAKGDNRRSPAFRTKAWEGLSVFTMFNRGNGQKLRGCYGPLSSSTMESNFYPESSPSK